MGIQQVDSITHVFTSKFYSVQFSSVTQSWPTLCNPWTAACQASMFVTNSWSSLKLMSTELVMPSNHLILCRPLLLPPTIFPSIRIISSDSVLHNQVTKILEFQLQHQSFQWIFRTDFLEEWLVWSPCSPKRFLNIWITSKQIRKIIKLFEK